MRSVILGAGEVATAVCLSQLANGRRCSLRMRDENQLQRMRSEHVFSSFQPLHRLSIPSSDKAATQLQMQRFGDPLQDPVNSIFVCTPSSSFFTSKDENDGAKMVSNLISDEVIRVLAMNKELLMMSKQQQTTSDSADPLAKAAFAAAAANPPPASHRPSVVLFSRGLLKDGRSPVQLLRSHLATAASSGLVEGPVSNIHVVLGAFTPREWALDSSKFIDMHAVEGEHPASVDFVAASKASVATLSAAHDLHASLQSSSGVQRAFSRESFVVPPPVLGPCDEISDALDMVDVYSVVSAAELVIAFGAGLVSNEYPACMSASMSYYAHASEATGKLLMDLFGRQGGSGVEKTAGTDALDQWLAKKRIHSSKAATQESPRVSALETFIRSPIFAACLMRAAINQSSKEFALGRKMRVAFSKRDALRSTFGFQNAQEAQVSLDHTMQGLYHRMRNPTSVADGVICTNPFFESLFDAYHTLRRSEDVGKQLIKIGWYQHDLEAARMNAPSSFMSHVKRMDDAVDSGDGYDEKRAAFAQAHGKSHSQAGYDLKPSET